MGRRGKKHFLGERYAAIRRSWDAQREAERRELLCRIESAFGAVQLCGGLSLHQGRARDNYESPEGVAAARTFDTEVTWQEIPDAKVDRLGDALSFLDAEGFRFYIPRFMMFALEHSGHSSSWASAAPVYCADVPEGSGQLALLSAEQREVLREFVRFFKEPG
jgi:hypothetical protein